MNLKSILAFVISMTLVLNAISQNDKKPKPQNIIILIADGMGFPEITAATLEKKSDLNLSRFPVTGIMKTSSFDNTVVDECSGATAIACGVKTYNGMIGLDTNQKPVNNLFFFAKLNGKSVGIVTAGSVLGPVPAAFYAHQPTRYVYDKIARELIKSNIDVFIGGGMKYFENFKTSNSLLKLLQERDYKILEKTRDLKKKSHAKIAGLVEPENLPAINKVRGNYFELAWQRAFKTLVLNDKGYLLVIENPHINWAATLNDKEYMLAEILDFDKTIGQVLDYVGPDNRTLVIVLGGFETGGVTIPAYPRNNKGEPLLKWTNGQKNTALMPVYAFGPYSELFTGTFENIDIFYKILNLLQ